MRIPCDRHLALLVTLTSARQRSHITSIGGHDWLALLSIGIPLTQGRCSRLSRYRAVKRSCAGTASWPRKFNQSRSLLIANFLRGPNPYAKVPCRAPNSCLSERRMEAPRSFLDIRLGEDLPDCRTNNTLGERVHTRRASPLRQNWISPQSGGQAD